jgi:NAD(P) transhydrogenase subunit beta
VPGFIINLAYVVASVLFILGLKGLTHPRTAVRGNVLGALGMFLAVLVTLADRNIIGFELIFIGIVVGSGIGALLATRIQMTAMPQMVGLLNGFGGAASVLVAGAALIEAVITPGPPSMQTTIATAASGLIGAVTFWGSMIAFGKLQGIVSEKSITLPGHQVVNALLFVVCIAVGVLIAVDPGNQYYYWALVGVASIFGLTLVLPVGGADMPVVIALLNSYSGIAASATGFVINNNVLIISGSLVGASGIILTQIMCSDEPFAGQCHGRRRHRIGTGREVR